MKRFIKKYDYEMNKLGQSDPKKALQAWYKICHDETFIKNAIEIIEDKNGEKTFVAPTICHMILSNPWDIDKNIYDNFVVTLFNNPELSKLVVFENMTFLYLILLNGALGFDELYLKLASEGIRNKAQDEMFELRRVVYNDVPSICEEVAFYQNDDIKVSLTEDEMDLFSSKDAFSISSEFSLGEIEKLTALLENFPDMDSRILSSIAILKQHAENNQRNISQDITLKRA